MIHDIFGSVRRSLVFRTPPDSDEGDRIVDKIGSAIRKSRVGIFTSSRLSPTVPSSPVMVKDKDENSVDIPSIRWRRGELIGCGAFGRVYMGMNLDSGELLAVKQVLIASNNASKEKAQAHVRELEEEVRLLKNLSHPNIVRYLGTAREDGTLNILLEFVPGGSISSLLGKFGAFPEAVIRTYTQQLLLGLEYLHKNGIMHRDIKGANILVDNKGCIKLADFGASKKVVELATMTGAKSMKGTPYWMAPEVILQTGHNFQKMGSQNTVERRFCNNVSADIWSVGCTVIEMATGKPPWSEQYQEVAALFHIGTTKSHPPIPEQLAPEAKDFLLKCLQKEPNLRPAASELLQHPFVTGKHRETHPVLRTSSLENSDNPLSTDEPSPLSRPRRTCSGLKDVCDIGSSSVRCSTIYPEKFSEALPIWGPRDSDDDMCRLDDDDCVLNSGNFDSVSKDLNQSYNPMCEPNDDWGLDASPETKLDSSKPFDGPADSPDFTFPCEVSVTEEDDEVTESKIRAFLGEKALDLKKLQTPLYEEYYNTINGTSPLPDVVTEQNENITYLKLPPKSKSPNRVSPLMPNNTLDSASPGSSSSRRQSNISGIENINSQDASLPEQTPREIQKKWKEELDQELERKRELMRQQGGVGGKTLSPKLTRQRSRFASPGK